MDDAVLDQTTAEPIIDQTSVDTTADNGQGNDQPQDQQTSTEDRDWRKFNPEWSKEFKALREMYPDKADMFTKWRDDLARFGDLRQIAPKGLDDVKGWKSLVDTIGGPEQAATLMESASRLEGIDAKVMAGDASIYDELPDEMKQGFDGIVASRFNALAESNDPRFAEMVTPHFQKALSGTGLGQLFTQAREAIAAGNADKAAELLGQGENWYKQQTGNIQTQPQQQRVDPKYAAMERELNEARSSKQSEFKKAITDVTDKHMGDTFTSNADVYVKQLGLTPQQQEDLKESFNSKLVSKLQTDSVFQKQLGAYGKMRNVDPATVQNYIRGKIDEYSKPIMDGIVTARYGKRTAPPPVVPTGQQTTNGAVRVAQAPDQSQWDMDKMDSLGYQATVKSGLYWLKGGKSVQVIR